MNIQEVTGSELDALVAEAEGLAVPRRGWASRMVDGVRIDAQFEPSSRWSDGGPIIQRERIGVIPFGNDGQWLGSMPGDVDYYIGADGADGQMGTNPLMAAMRAYVAAKIGK